jgi:hypothetical protein
MQKADTNIEEIRRALNVETIQVREMIDKFDTGKKDAR